MPLADHLEPSATQSTGDITSRDDVIKTVSGSGMYTLLHRANSDAYPARVGYGARTRDERQPPTSGAQRGRGPSKPVAVTHSAPEAATSAGTQLTDFQLPSSGQHGDHPHSSDSDDRLDKEDKRKTKRQATSPWTSIGVDDGAQDKTSNSIIVVEPLIVTPPTNSISGYDQELDSSLTAFGDRECSRQTRNQEESRGQETTSSYSRQTRAGDADPVRRKVKSEGR